MIRHSPTAATLLLLLAGAGPVGAEPPVAAYIFPAGGRRGTTVEVRVGGLYLHRGCAFELLGPGVTADARLKPATTLWFEGPLLPLPESQQAEDYPKDMAGQVRIAADAPLGARSWRLSTSQGATPALRFVVGDLPEILEEETDGDPVPVPVAPPVTVNGRIFPREDVDAWAVPLRKGQSLRCEVEAARLGSPLDARLEVLDPHGRVLAENEDHFGADPLLRFTAPADGTYQVRIHDVQTHGGQAYVYRLTLTTDPAVDCVYPLGGRRGSTTRFELTGQGLPQAVDVALPADGPRDYSHRLDVGGRLTNPFLLELDDLAEHREAEPNDERAAPPVTAPAVLNGRIDRPGDVDAWTLTARKGDVYDIDLRAARLGSPLAGVLVLADGTGKEVARADAVAAGQLDPSLRFTVPADGTYTVRVSDRFRGRGGPEFAYRLRIAPPAAPDFRLQLAADALTLPRGGQGKLRVTVERQGGFAGAVALAVEGLPPGVTVSGTTVAANQGATEVGFKAETSAPVRADRLTVRGTAEIAGRGVTRTAALPAPRGLPEIDTVLLAVAVPTPFKVKGTHDMRWAPRGTVHTRRYRIERNGYDGPLEVSLADRQARHLQGVTGPTVTVPVGATEFEYPVQLAPWMETGRTCRVTVMAVGEVKDADGTSHTVSFSSAQPDEQVIVVVEPGILGVEAERTSLLAVPGQTAAVPVRVTRAKGLAGPVRVELVVAAHVRGVSAEPVVIAAGQERGELVVRFGADARGPFNMPLLVRATATDKGKPVVAEDRIALAPAR